MSNLNPKTYFAVHAEDFAVFAYLKEARSAKYEVQSFRYSQVYHLSRIPIRKIIFTDGAYIIRKISCEINDNSKNNKNNKNINSSSRYFVK